MCTNVRKGSIKEVFSQKTMLFEKEVLFNKSAFNLINLIPLAGDSIIIDPLYLAIFKLNRFVKLNVNFLYYGIASSTKNGILQNKSHNILS